MAITFTSLTNEAAVAKNWVTMTQDSNATVHLNTSDTAFRVTTTSRSRLAGKNRLGQRMRQWTFTILSEKPYTQQVAGTNMQLAETIKSQITVWFPEFFTTFTLQDLKDHFAYFRQILTGANAILISRGEF